MVFRVYVEKKQELAHEATSLMNDLREFLGIHEIEGLRVINRYDAEGLTMDLFNYCKTTVFSEPQIDVFYDNLELAENETVFAVEYLPGQYDQRADSAAQCIQIISKSQRPLVRTAKVYVMTGKISAENLEKIKAYVINPVEARLASLELPQSLELITEAVTDVEILDGFMSMDEAGLVSFHRERGLAMDIDDLRFCRDYFKGENREPSITEIKVIDTYWSDHCRHTTFFTELKNVSFDDEIVEEAWERYIGVREMLNRTKPISLMDLGTIATKFLLAEGMLQGLDESEEINACTVKIKIEVDGKLEDWLLLFKNETHNHPTEIEPFGGAATCIGGAIRDPLSGRSYVYAAMRVTGAANPLADISETIVGKLPQRKLTATAAAGYSSYGNQIGLATGSVDEIYHAGYAAKRMEVGAVIAAAPAEAVRRERPSDGDLVILLGGKTGRDGCGGATGSSKSHDVTSLETCGSEVQKGNAPEERKLQRLFRNPVATKLIKRCNDFGAGGVSVAVGELAEGLTIWLSEVPKKYDGLDPTELAISESQERMAVVVEAKDAQEFMALASLENLESTIIAKVTEEKRLIMKMHDKEVVNLSREFLDTNGAPKEVEVHVAESEAYDRVVSGTFTENMRATASDLNSCSRRGLAERFDSTIGAGSVLMPFGGKNQLTPVQAMVNKISLEKGKTEDCSFMSWGFNPFISEKSPYHGAYLAVVESCSKLVATGAEFSDVYLSFQEYFEKLGKDKTRWGKPLAALLGALDAQMELQISAIGGKDSMSGSFMDMDVPPTLISFAVTSGKTSCVVSPEFKSAGSKVIIIRPEYDDRNLPTGTSLQDTFLMVNALILAGAAKAVWTPTYGGIAEGVMKMTLGNDIGFEFCDSVSLEDIFAYNYGSFIIELADETVEVGEVLGYTTDLETISYKGEVLEIAELFEAYEAKLEPVFKSKVPQSKILIPTISSEKPMTAVPLIKTEKPRVLIPVFPGTNCEYDTARAFREAGAEPEIFVVRNLTAEAISRSVDDFAEKTKEAQMIFLPGGFSGGDEPDGSGKFITAFLRNPSVKDAVTELLDIRGGMMGGICNGFQALIKLGLVPFGKIMDVNEHCPTLSYNVIGRHQSRLVRTRVASNMSPWFKNTKVGEVYTVPVSHGEGRFIASDGLIEALIENGQVLTQYVDQNDRATSDILYNPNGSAYAIEGICSPDGRVFGKMGHSERIGEGLYQNVVGDYDMGLFKSAVEFFR